MCANDTLEIVLFGLVMNNKYENKRVLVFIPWNFQNFPRPQTTRGSQRMCARFCFIIFKNTTKYSSSKQTL